MTEPRRHITNPLFPWPPTEEPEPDVPGWACDPYVAEWDDAFTWSADDDE